MIPILLCAMLTVGMKVPILMYHDFTEAPTGNPWQLSAERFEEHLSALSEAGYSGIGLRELADYAAGVSDLPDKCVVITSDDGYDGVLEIAAPVCERYGMTLSCAIIGTMAGEMGHFDPAEGVPSSVELTSHGYDLHRMTEEGPVILAAGDSLGEKLAADTERMNQLFGEEDSMISRAFVYPYGAYTPESDEILRELGVEITLTCEPGCAFLTPGDPGCLFGLPRLTMEESLSGDELLRMLSLYDH